MADATDLHDDLATQFLAACVEALDTIPDADATLEGAPERRFISANAPAPDCCPQLTVHTGTLSEGSAAPARPKTSIAHINHVQLLATIVRCTPQPNINTSPTEAEQEAAAEQINADKWALWNHIYNMIREGLLFDKCGDVIWNGITPLGPSGGCGGSVLTVTVSFDGYESVFGT